MQVIAVQPLAPPAEGAGPIVGANTDMSVRVELRHKVYYPGNVVEGVAVINVVNQTTVGSIRLELVGEEYVKNRVSRRVTTGSGKKRRSHTKYTTYRSIKHHYSKLVTLVGPPKAAGIEDIPTFDISPGIYTYPFAFQLPIGLPPSFKSEKGYDATRIQYFVEMQVDGNKIHEKEPGFWETLLLPAAGTTRFVVRMMTAGCYFSVVRPMPLSQWSIPVPHSFSKEYDIKASCPCAGDKGRCKLSFSIDRTVIAIDRDTIRVDYDIDNTHGLEGVRYLYIGVHQETKYVAQGHHDVLKKVASENKLWGPNHSFFVNPGETKRGSTNIVVNRDANPCVLTEHVRSEYVLQVGLDVENAVSPFHEWPLIVGQTVDNSNRSPPFSFSGKKEVPLLDAVGTQVGTQFVHEEGDAKFIPVVEAEVLYAVPPQPAYPATLIPGSQGASNVLEAGPAPFDFSVFDTNFGTLPQQDAWAAPPPACADGPQAEWGAPGAWGAVENGQSPWGGGGGYEQPQEAGLNPLVPTPAENEAGDSNPWGESTAQSAQPQPQ